MAQAPTANAAPPIKFPLLPALLLVVAVALAFSNTLDAPFVFDDIASIRENPSLRSRTIADTLAPPAGLTVSGRPLLNVSLALNYLVGGESVRGYHLVNLAIHALAALVLFGLLRRTFNRPRFRERFERDGPIVAFSAALIWALHPLQTESVTYMIQRAESLMGLFYLLTLYGFARSVEAPSPRRWQIGCVAACAFGMATKEVMVSAPLVVLLYDWVFVAGDFLSACRLRWRFYVALASTWLVLAVSAMGAGDRGGTAGFSSGVAPWDYLLTQSRAIVHYLQLAVWPHPLVFDYGPYERASGRELWPFAVGIVAMLVATGWLLRRRLAAGFALACVFLILAPTSSLVPIATEPVAEHRMYLPLAALAALVTVGLYRWGKVSGLALTVAIAMGLGMATWARNADYRTERALWEATVEAAPKNPRAHSSLAWALLATHEPAAAEAHFRTAIALRPDYLDARRGLARILEESGRLGEAEMEYRAILRRAPDDFVAHCALGTRAFQAGNLPAAIIHFESAVRTNPAAAAAHNNLGCAFYEAGNLSAAQTHEETAIRLKADDAEAHFNLGNTLARQNLLAAARDAYQRALHLDPDYAEAHAHLGVVFQNLGEFTAAIAQYREALRLRPDFAFVQTNLDALLAAGRKP